MLRKIIISVLILPIVTLVVLVAYCNVDTQVKKKKGIELCKALNLYQKEYGSIPDSISQLLSKYYEDEKTIKLFYNGSMTYWPDLDKQCFRLGIPASIMDYWILTCECNTWEYH